MPSSPVHDAHVVLPCPDLAAALPFYVDTLGLRVETIWPADEPRYAVVAGHGVRLALDPAWAGPAGLLRLRCPDPDAVAGGRRTLVAPNGTVVELVDADPPVVVPPLVNDEIVVTRAGQADESGTGRAGMRYRDLLPGRLGGRFIASHIAIPDGGPVPDYVHFHKIRFQMIYCRRGWVRVVYEDQGEPFVMQAGDCVLQPPRIRHRVLESSPGMEVVEIACPAEHETHADPALALPNDRVDAGRDFEGQRFVRHVAADAAWSPWRLPGHEARDVGIGAATAGVASVVVTRRAGPAPAVEWSHRGELLFLFVLDGAVTLRSAGRDDEALTAGDSASVPPGLVHSLADCSDDLALLEVALPGPAC